MLKKVLIASAAGLVGGVPTAAGSQPAARQPRAQGFQRILPDTG